MVGVISVAVQSCCSSVRSAVEGWLVFSSSSSLRKVVDSGKRKSLRPAVPLLFPGSGLVEIGRIPNGVGHLFFRLGQGQFVPVTRLIALFQKASTVALDSIHQSADNPRFLKARFGTAKIVQRVGDILPEALVTHWRFRK